MRVYFDADIVIENLRGREAARSVLRRVAADGDELWMAAPQRAEVLFFMRPTETELTMAILGQFGTEPLTREMVDVGAAYFRRWHPSHGIDRNDALLAGTAKLTGGRIITQNVRHFPMPDITVEQGWDPQAQT